MPGNANVNDNGMEVHFDLHHIVGQIDRYVFITLSSNTQKMD